MPHRRANKFPERAEMEDFIIMSVFPSIDTNWNNSRLVSKIKWLKCREVLQGALVSLAFSSGQSTICLVVWSTDILEDLFSTIPYVFWGLIRSVSTLAQRLPVCQSQTLQCSSTIIFTGNWRNVLFLQKSKSSSNIFVQINATVL